ncbi:MAG: DUF2339 domain-containing protein, partial [Gemmatimonadetes bacterium]|nr:DUF2339 domain-containing protein [Gemmatimonadota bacterium]
YMARAWRALLLMAVVIAWLVLSLAVSLAAGSPGNSAWVVQGGIAFCALVFWLVPLLRAGLRGQNPGRWLRPESAYPAELETREEAGTGPPPATGSWFDLDRKSAAGTPYVRWNEHLDALSLLMPLVAIGLSAWLWELSRSQLGFAFLGTALLAQGVGSSIARFEDPEDSASTQSFVAILLSTVGLGLVLTGDILYLAFIAEAAALFAVGSRKGSKILLGLGGVVELLVLGLFVFRLASGGTLLEGDLTAVFDMVAIGGAAFIGTQIKGREGRWGFFTGAYLAFLAFTTRELIGHLSFLYLAFLVEAVATHIVAARRKDQLLEGLGHVSMALVVAFFFLGFPSGRTLLGGDLTLMVDVAALLGAVYVGTLVSASGIRRGFFAGAYLGLLALMGRELSDHFPVLYLAFIAAAVATQVVASRKKISLLSDLGHLPALVLLAFFWLGFQSGRTLLAGDPVSLVDVVALAATAYVGTLLTDRQGRLVYFFAAYVGLLAWTGRELYPFESGQALMSLAFGLEGTVVLVAGFFLDRSLLQKTGMATLLLVVAKVML